MTVRAVLPLSNKIEVDAMLKLLSSNYDTPIYAVLYDRLKLLITKKKDA